jgi:hypothetical protein
MRLYWKIVSPILGVLLFGLGSWSAFRFNRQAHMVRYFYWSSIALDSDPLSKTETDVASCSTSTQEALCWDPESIWVEPGWLAKSLMISAFPAFIAGLYIVHTLTRVGFGISEVKTFMVIMPVLIFGWYYLVALLVDRGLKWRRASARSSV